MTLAAVSAPGPERLWAMWAESRPSTVGASKGAGSRAASRDLGGRPCGPTSRACALRGSRRPLSSARCARCARRRRVSSRGVHCVHADPRTAQARRLPRALQPGRPRLCGNVVATRTPPRRRRAAWGSGAAGRGRRRGSQGWGRRAQRASTSDSPASCAARGAKWTARPQPENRSGVDPQGRPPRSARRARTPSRSGAPTAEGRLSSAANSRSGPKRDDRRRGASAA
jgi:hypothetical protein